MRSWILIRRRAANLLSDPQHRVVRSAAHRVTKKFQQINRFSIFIDFIDTWRVRLISHFAVGLFSLSMSPVELDKLLWDLTLLFLSVYCRTFSYHVYLFRQLLDSQVASLRPFVCFFLMRVLYLAYYIVWHNKRVVIVLIVVLLHNK